MYLVVFLYDSQNQIKVFFSRMINLLKSWVGLSVGVKNFHKRVDYSCLDIIRIRFRRNVRLWKFINSRHILNNRLTGVDQLNFLVLNIQISIVRNNQSSGSKLVRSLWENIRILIPLILMFEGICFENSRNRSLVPLFLSLILSLWKRVLGLLVLSRIKRILLWLKRVSVFILSPLVLERVLSWRFWERIARKWVVIPWKRVLVLGFWEGVWRIWIWRLEIVSLGALTGSVRGDVSHDLVIRPCLVGVVWAAWVWVASGIVSIVSALEWV